MDTRKTDALYTEGTANHAQGVALNTQQQEEPLSVQGAERMSMQGNTTARPEGCSYDNAELCTSLRINGVEGVPLSTGI
jgi:hypothetical protein